MTRYHGAYAEWRQDPEGFWTEAAKAIDWDVPPAQILATAEAPSGRWFEGAQCNTCYNCVDRHVRAGHGARAAIRYDSPVTGTKDVYSYDRLLAEVSALASVLRARGVGRGDRVLIYMPMVPEALVAMLASARLGAVHSVVFGGFSAEELALRIDDAKPAAIVSASCGIEPARIVAYKPLLDAALHRASHDVPHCLILQRERQRCDLLAGRDEDYATVVGVALAAGETTDCVAVAATDPLYILYTSGTTGRPKGVVRDNGGHMVALRWSMEHHYGLEPGETFWAASDVGWVVGHSYICYGPLLHGCATVLYEGKPTGTPDAGAFWRVIAEHEVAALFTAPTALRAIRKVDPDGLAIAPHDLSRFRTLFLAGERSDATTVAWAREKLGRPVVDHWWQTETGWPMTGNPVGLGLLPVRPGAAGVPMPGYDIRVLDDAGSEVPPGTLGNIVCKLPLPPAGFTGLWGAKERYHDTYFAEFPGYYATSDAGFRDAEGYVHIMARTDDVINVAGHRLSTGSIEEAISSHPDVAECAVVGRADDLKGQVPLGFVILKDGVTRDAATLGQELVALVRDRVGPVAAFRETLCVARLPKTRSGKILRGTMQKLADGEEVRVPPALEEPQILDEIRSALRAHLDKPAHA
ncbi:AMP-binding protein [Salipiger marinus]|uniref:AMP-binding protein n=1 Tax=Salipiger marinus TaxID=555512 RepID=UPI0040594AAE